MAGRAPQPGGGAAGGGGTTRGPGTTCTLDRTKPGWRAPGGQGTRHKPIVNRIADLHAEITAWRRDIHAHPELLYDVHRTAATVADKLKSFGCDEVVTGIGRTGVVGVIRGGKGAGRAG